MRKLIAAAMAVVTALSLNVGAFAATATTITKDIKDISGNPINEDGVQIALSGTIPPNQTIYFAIPDSIARNLNNSKLTRLSSKKETNGKLVKSVKLVEKRLSNSGTYQVPNGNGGLQAFNANQRKTYLAVDLNEVTGPDEYKIQITSTFTAKKGWAAMNYGGNVKQLSAALPTGSKLVLKTTFFVGNPTEEGDASVSVGKQGLTVKPLKNDKNEIVFEGEDTLATLRFTANSNPSKFFAKLNTSWTSTLLQKFKDTDAVIRRFSPASISATGRATLALNNPFDLDDVDPDDVYIYTADAKNNLKDITRSVTYNEDDDTFELKTRSLTTYIISDVKVKTK